MILFIIVFLFVMASCAGKHDAGASNNNVINLKLAINNSATQMLISDAADDIEIIPLETTEKSVFDYSKIKHIVSANNDVFITTGKRIMHFNKKGNYVGDIGSYGQAPMEYDYASSLGYDERKKILYVTSGFSTTNMLKAYDNEGKYKESIKIAKDGVFINTVATRNELAEYRYIDGFHLFRRMLPIPDMRQNPWQIMIKDTLNNLITTITDPIASQHQMRLLNSGGFEISRAGNYWSAFEPVINSYKGKHSVMFDGNDTIYKIGTGMIRLYHRFLIDTGSEQLDEIELHQLDKTDNYLNNYIHPTYFLETKNFLYIVAEKDDYAYLCQYNKHNGEICSIKKQGEIRFSELMNVHYRRMQLPQFTDDITGGCSFYPDHHNDNEWIGVIPAERLLSEIDINELEKKEVKLPHRKQQLIKVLKNLKEDDNPVLMIVKLK